MYSYRLFQNGKETEEITGFLLLKEVTKEARKATITFRQKNLDNSYVKIVIYKNHRVFRTITDKRK